MFHVPHHIRRSRVLPLLLLIRYSGSKIEAGKPNILRFWKYLSVLPEQMSQWCRKLGFSRFLLYLQFITTT
jgi:hypothetical protein